MNNYMLGANMAMYQANCASLTSMPMYGAGDSGPAVMDYPMGGYGFFAYPGAYYYGSPYSQYACYKGGEALGYAISYPFRAIGEGICDLFA